MRRRLRAPLGRHGVANPRNCGRSRLLTISGMTEKGEARTEVRPIGLAGDSLDEQELLRRWHEDGDREARRILIERMMPLVRSLARRYAGRGETLDDLEQVGCVGLIKAVDRFDLSRELRFSTFAVPTILGEIKRHFRD